MKKILAIVLVCFMAFAAVACSEETASESSNVFQTSSQADSSKEEAGNMWQYECIQLQFSSIAPDDEYYVENWDGIRNKTAANANIVRQTGYAVNEEGDTLTTVWIGSSEAGHQAVCVRDDENAKTYYEIVMPWSDLGSGDYVVDAKKGTSFGMAISINCGDDNTFRNIVLRDGGGIMGCNDWTKIPTLTLN